jgi:hypothetical protein
VPESTITVPPQVVNPLLPALPLKDHRHHRGENRQT